MENYDRYHREYEKAEVFFQGQISDKEAKAFEYGTLIIRSAILISGGGLLAIPAILGLGDNLTVDLNAAASAGRLFAASIVAVILGAYIVHLNWTLHTGAWNLHWADRQKWLKAVYLENKEGEELTGIHKVHMSKSISLSFWFPHILAGLYFGLLICAFFQLYQAFGIVAVEAN